MECERRDEPTMTFMFRIFFHFCFRVWGFSSGVYKLRRRWDHFSRSSSHFPTNMQAQLCPEQTPRAPPWSDEAHPPLPQGHCWDKRWGSLHRERGGSPPLSCSMQWRAPDPPSASLIWPFCALRKKKEHSTVHMGALKWKKLFKGACFSIIPRNLFLQLQN